MELKLILEAILFNSQKPLTPRELREILTATADQPDPGESGEPRALKKIKEEAIVLALEELQRDHEAAARSHRLACVAGAWQFVSLPDYAPWLRTLLGVKNRPPRLTQPALETLAIVAYRQPITRAEMEQIRGVAVDGVVTTLVERGLIHAVGRAEVVGRPITYGTTPLFLEYFGLRDLDELPAADELRRIVVEKPEALLTTESNGSASAGVEEPAAASAPPAENPPAAADTPTAAEPASPETPAPEPETPPSPPAP